MKLSEVQRRLHAPFSAHLVQWRGVGSTDGYATARVQPYLTVQTVYDRFDAVCPDGWQFEISVVAEAEKPTVKGRLTVLGVVREDIGEASGGAYAQAAEEALLRCAAQFGVGRYLQDLPEQVVIWDRAAGRAAQPPASPEWALPDYERTPGGRHITAALDRLRAALPADDAQQREIYRHLKQALALIGSGESPDPAEPVDGHGHPPTEHGPN